MGILSNIWLVLLIIFLVSSVFILFGMTLAYLLKSESTTLLISTFFLVFLMFFSGFLLPVERMTKTAAGVANTFPGKLGLDAFSKVVFYGQGYDVVHSEVMGMCGWFVFLVALAMLTKRVRNS